MMISRTSLSRPLTIDVALFEPREAAVSSYIGLRRGVGIIGMCLPIVLPLLTTLAFQQDLPSSVSGYYHTAAGNILVGAMCAIGVFLLWYNFARIDNWVSNVAGVAAIVAGVVPTAKFSNATGLTQTASVIHLVASAILFLSLAVFCLFLFIRSNLAGYTSPQKKERNIVYQICGWVIVACLVLAVLVPILLDKETIRGELRPIFWLESIAIVAFGISWLVKGGWLFRDQAPDAA